MRNRQRATEVGLQLEVIWRDEDVFKILVSVWNGEFGGTTETYAAIGGLKEIAEKLLRFPRHPTDVREVVVGSFGREFAGGAASMRFYCIDHAGHAYVEVKIESEFESAGVVQYVIISMPIEAAAVDLFVGDLSQLETERSGTAMLLGRG